jgi:hypothetical protein
MPTTTQKICTSYAATIRHIEKVELPAIDAKLGHLNALLASLQEQGAQDSELQPVLSAINLANQNLADATGELEAFSQEYEILGCASAGGAPVGGQ